MKIEIEATEKEIAALVDMIRGQRKDDIIHCYDSNTQPSLNNWVQNLKDTINCSVQSSNLR